MPVIVAARPRPDDAALAPVWERASAAIAERGGMVLSRGVLPTGVVSRGVLMMEAVGSRRP